METNAAFVRANSIVELNAIANVGLHFALVVYPRNAEGENAVGFNHSFNDFCFFEFGMFVVDILNRQKNFSHGLKIFLLARVLSFEVAKNFVYIHDTDKFILSRMFHLVWIACHGFVVGMRSLIFIANI